MESVLFYLLILFSVTATKASLRKERQVLEDDKKIMEEILNQLKRIQSILQNKSCHDDDKISAKIGSVYTRWGRSKCPRGSELVYNGRAAGSHYTHIGGAANTLCLPLDPEWRKNTPGFQSHSAYVYGAEYETKYSNSPFKKTHDHEIPCAVCRTEGRPNLHMIPAKITCKSGWTIEYTGYLMAGLYYQKSATEYVCMDEHPEILGHTATNSDGRLFYAVEAACGSLPCSTYTNGAELTCVVCSK